MVIDPINAEKDGTSRTIKAQYQQTSIHNFYATSTFGATGVVEEPQGVIECESKKHYIEKPKYGVRVRKLTERECFRLMGVKDEDSDLIGKRQCAGGKYHMAGDSIVTTCLMALFGEALGVDYWNKIDELTKELKEEIWQ